MRFIISIILLFSNVAMATGKLTLQNNLHDDGKTYRPIIGFSVYEKVFRNVALNSWMGYGIQEPAQDNLNWFVAKAQFDFPFKKVVVAPGVQYKNLISTHDQDVMPYIQISYVLW